MRDLTDLGSDGSILADLAPAIVRAAHDVEFDDATRHGAARCVLDWAGCAAGGVLSEFGDVLAVGADLFGDSDACTLVARPRRSGPFEAAFSNGAASHYLDYDDVSVLMKGHAGVVVVPCVLALAEAVGATGRETLDAVVVGYQAGGVVGELVDWEHYHRGWHSTGTLGAMAAAVAGARLLGLSIEASANAVRAAATQSGGVRGAFGSHGKPLHAGHASAVGLMSSMLARAGLRMAPSTVAGTSSSYLTLVAGDLHLDVVDGSRKLEPVVNLAAFKLHAACGATHSTIEAVAGLIRDESLDPEQIASIHADVHRTAVVAAGKRQPLTGLDAKFSLWHAAAQAAFAYPLTPRYFSDAAINSDARVLALRDRVTISVDESMVYDPHLAMPARVRIVMQDGQEFERLVSAVPGRAANPLDDGALSTKFAQLTSPVLGETGAVAAAEAILALDQAPDVRPVAAALGASVSVA